MPASGRDASGQAVATALLVRHATAPGRGPTGARRRIHHLFKSMK